METTTILLCIIAGFVAGVINTLAGSGSVITLSLLSFLGLPANIANGTNRVGILLQSLVSSVKFKQTGKLEVFKDRKIIVITVIGAVGGMLLASQLDPQSFEKVVGAIFFVLFFVILLKPEKRLKKDSRLSKLVPLSMFFIGFYAGFIQAGAGVFMLAIMTTFWQEGISKMNPLKVVIILCINALALGVYAYFNQVNWKVGLVIAIGQFVGGYVGVGLNNSKKNLEPILRLLLLGLIILSICKFWGIIEL